VGFGERFLIGAVDGTLGDGIDVDMFVDMLTDPKIDLDGVGMEKFGPGWFFEPRREDVDGLVECWCVYVWGNREENGSFLKGDF
jgi:hypothetical protein